MDDLISELFIENPNKRITWEDYFNHPFFVKNNIDTEKTNVQTYISKEENKTKESVNYQSESVTLYEPKNDYKNNYEIGPKIGDTIFGLVYEVKMKKTGEKRALKIIDKNTLRKLYNRKFLKEPDEIDMKPFYNIFYNEMKYMQIIAGEKNENFAVKYYELFDNNNEIAIVMEKCDDNLLHLFSKYNIFLILQKYMKY